MQWKESNELGEDLYAAADQGDVAKVTTLLKTPGINVNYFNDVSRHAVFTVRVNRVINININNV